MMWMRKHAPRSGDSSSHTSGARADDRAGPGDLLRIWRERRRFRSSRPRRGPDRVQVGITDRCNYRCLMCTMHSPLVTGLPPESQRAQMSLNTFRGLLRDLKHLSGTVQLDLVGVGEPLLHPDCLQMVTEARQFGFRVGVATNGSLLDEDRSRQLAELGLYKLHLSINSGSEEVYQQVHQNAPAGTRQRILDCLKEMNAHCDLKGIDRPRLALACVIFKHNYRDLPGLVRSAAEVEATDVHLMPMGTTPETERIALDESQWQQARGIMHEAHQLALQLGLTTNAPDLLMLEQPGTCRDVYREVPCYVGHNFSLIFADGQVRFCCGCDLTVGNLNDHSFREIWRGSTYAETRRQALGLPRSGKAPAGCACFQACPHWRDNVATHQCLHPHSADPEGAPWVR